MSFTNFPIPTASAPSLASDLRSAIDVLSKTESFESFGLRILYGNQQKLAAKVAADPTYKAKVLYVGDSLCEGKMYLLNNIMLTTDNRRSSMINGTFGGSGTTLDGQAATWPDGRVKVLSDSLTSFVVADSGGTVVVNANKFHVGHIAENGAGTYKIECGNTITGPWTEISASVDANNGGVATGVFTTYSMPWDGPLAIRITRISGTTRFVCFGASYDGVQGGMFALHRGGYDLSPHFIAADQNIVAPIVAAWDPDVIYWEAADSAALQQTHLVNYINKLQANMATKAGVICATRNPWRDDANDTEQKSQAEALYAIAKSNGYGFVDWRHLFGAGTLADALGLVLPSGNVHPSTIGYQLQIDRLRSIWPSVWNYDRQTNYGSSIRSTVQPITPTTLVEAILLQDVRQSVALGCATTSTTTGGFANKDDGLVTVGINANVTSGSSKAILRGNVFCGAGTGAGTRWNGPLGFQIKFIGTNFPSATHRVFLGQNGQELTGNGIGVEFASDGAYLLAHNGTTLTRSFIPGSNTNIGNNENLGSFLYGAPLQNLIVTSDGAGNVRCYWVKGPNRTKANILVHSITGGPTALTTPNADKWFISSSTATGVSNVNSPRLSLISADIITGF